VGKARIGDAVGSAAVGEALADFDGAPRDVRATAVRYLLQRLVEAAPGNSVEVRVPPFGAVQCIEGPGHTRGTPPNVVEMDARTWLALATGALSWSEGRASARISASGQRADLSAHVPLRGLAPR
jgi:hypothetical protein